MKLISSVNCAIFVMKVLPGQSARMLVADLVTRCCSQTSETVVVFSSFFIFKINKKMIYLLNGVIIIILFQHNKLTSKYVIDIIVLVLSQP